MKIFKTLILISILQSLHPVLGHMEIHWNGTDLLLKNNAVERVIRWDRDALSIYTFSLKLPHENWSFVSEESNEFSFTANDRIYSGRSGWRIKNVSKVVDEKGGKGMGMTLVEDSSESLSLEVKLIYLLYPNNPVIRKRIELINNGDEDIKIENLDVENLILNGNPTHAWAMHDYARYKSLGQFISNSYDPLSIVHYVDNRRGIALGNEAPGVMKQTTAFLHPNEVTTGLTHNTSSFAFRKWLQPGEKWKSPWVFTAPYSNTDDPFVVANGPVNDFVRKHMGIRLAEIKQKPVFVYNTWTPFRHNIDENLIKELADAAQECGFEEFIIDDGWQTNYGDWGIDKEKFPGGLKPVFDYIKDKGMKPGLWISLAAADKESQVFKDHPDWLVRKADGSLINLHADFDKMYEWETYSMSMASGWKDHIKSIIVNLGMEHGLEYIKGDFAVATGAYTTDKTRSGDHGKNNNFYRDREESLLILYQKTWELFDELHEKLPDLFIDCTFETMGGFQLIDYDMCKHAEGNWLSNFEEPAPLGALRVRQMAWWRSPVIPATALVIGNQQLDDPMVELSIKSLAGSLPILLGDVRKLSKEERKRIRAYADWFRSCQTRHDYMMFRQDLQGYGEPQEGNWDGFQRINTDTKSGGIVGIFRQGSPENQRIVTVHGLASERNYRISNGPGSEDIDITLSGNQLATEGFQVKLKSQYDGALLEVNLID